jgi:hypothetical protein
MVALLTILIAAFVFIACFTRSGVNWWTWLLGKPTGSIRGGFLLIILIMLLLLIGGYILGYLA